VLQANGEWPECAGDLGQLGGGARGPQWIVRDYAHGRIVAIVERRVPPQRVVHRAKIMVAKVARWGPCAYA
jgi:hypothetical protein